MWQNLSNAQELAWQTLSPGLEYIKLNYLNETYPEGSLHAFAIDLKRYDLNIALAKDLKQQSTSVKDLVHHNKALIGINGGFFTPEFNPIGLRLRDYQILHPLVATSWWNVFLIHNNQAKILSQKGYKALENVQVAIQAGPRLIIESTIPRLKEGEAERSALCITDKNKVILAATQNLRLSTTSLAELLKDRFNCQDALNLDGGQSTQLYATLKQFNLNVRNFSAITDAVIVTPKITT